MKLRNIICMFIAAFMFAACEVIPEDDRFEEVELLPSDRVVLLTEFTGVRCVNCPDAAAVANELIGMIPNNIIVVGMHPEGHGFTAALLPEQNFCSVEAMEYLKFYGGSASTGFPTGVVNGSKFGGTYLQGHSKWTAQVLEKRALEPVYKINLSKSNTGEEFDVKAQIIPNGDNSSIKVSLQMWLVESGFVGPQASHTGTIKEYPHNHIFRQTIDGKLWGAELGNVAETITKEYKFEVDPKFKAENCAVVAVLIDTDTKEVVQASQLALGEGVAH